MSGNLESLELVVAASVGAVFWHCHFWPESFLHSSVMPTFACASRIKAVAGDSSLVLRVRHCLVAGQPSDVVYNPNGSHLPGNIDVLLSSGLVIMLSGVMDGAKVPPDIVAESQLALHLVNYFRTVLPVIITILTGLPNWVYRMLSSSVLLPYHLSMSAMTAYPNVRAFVALRRSTLTPLSLLSTQ